MIALTTPPGGIMTVEVGAITGDVELATGTSTVTVDTPEPSTYTRWLASAEASPKPKLLRCTPPTLMLTWRGTRSRHNYAAEASTGEALASTGRVPARPAAAR